MKIEVGKQYRMANGNVATIMEFQPHASHPWRGMFGTPDNGGSMSWDDTGEQCNRSDDYRLVGEIVPDEPTAAHVEAVAVDASKAFGPGHVYFVPKTPPSTFTLAPDNHPPRPDSDVIADLERIMSDDYRPAVAAWFNARYGA